MTQIRGDQKWVCAKPKKTSRYTLYSLDYTTVYLTQGKITHNFTPFQLNLNANLNQLTSGSSLTRVIHLIGKKCPTQFALKITSLFIVRTASSTQLHCLEFFWLEFYNFTLLKPEKNLRPGSSVSHTCLICSQVWEGSRG